MQCLKQRILLISIIFISVKVNEINPEMFLNDIYNFFLLKYHALKNSESWEFQSVLQRIFEREKHILEKIDFCVKNPDFYQFVKCCLFTGVLSHPALPSLSEDLIVEEEKESLCKMWMKISDFDSSFLNLNQKYTPEYYLNSKVRGFQNQQGSDVSGLLDFSEYVSLTQTPEPIQSISIF